MCRNIGTLYNCEHPGTDDEAHAAARQFAPNASGSNKPSVANQVGFDHAIETGSGAVRERTAKWFGTAVSP
jgi:hypothetical protein